METYTINKQQKNLTVFKT